jgi:hypothetical protein
MTRRAISTADSGLSKQLATVGVCMNMPSDSSADLL